MHKVSTKSPAHEWAKALSGRLRATHKDGLVPAGYLLSRLAVPLHREELVSAHPEYTVDKKYRAEGAIVAFTAHSIAIATFADVLVTSEVRSGGDLPPHTSEVKIANRRPLTALCIRTDHDSHSNRSASWVQWDNGKPVPLDGWPGPDARLDLIYPHLGEVSLSRGDVDALIPSLLDDLHAP